MADLNKEKLANLTPEQAVSDDELEKAAGGAVPKGNVKWFNNEKGFGFTTDEEKEKEFLNNSGIDFRKSVGPKPLSDDDVENVTGGVGPQIRGDYPNA